MSFDPFNDFATCGYLRNAFGEKDPNIIKHLEHSSFVAGISEAFRYLASIRHLSYRDVLHTHKILFGDVYPWAGQDRIETAPDIAVSKGRILFAHPNDTEAAVKYGLGLGADKSIMAARPGEVMGYLAYGHPFLDGNGRTIMVVHAELAERAGISIDWPATNKGAVEGLAAGSRHGMTDHHRAAVLDQFATIRDDQRAAFEHAIGTGGLALIDGQAGTGKSFTMNAIRRAYEDAGYRVIGLAPTNAVAQGMGTDGFRRAATVHSEIFALNNGRTQWDRRTVVMVDEAAMIDTKMMAALTAHAREVGAKLILVGDDRQLSSIERGGMFGALKDRYGAAALTEITRQYKQDDRRAAAMMAEGNFSDAVAIYEKKGAITWTRTQEEARARLVHRWTVDTETAPEKSRFVFAYTNVDVDALNQDLREVQRRRGVLGEDQELETAHGKRAFAAGDRLQFTATDKKQGIFNGAAGQVVAINGDAITVKLDGKQARELTFDAGGFKGFRHGYAGTIYKGQGRTLDQTYLYHSEHWRSAASYVALTRHRDKAELFVARNTAADTQQLARQMARVDDRRAASNFREADRVPSQDHDLTIPPAGGDLGLQAPPLTDDQIDWKRYTEDRAYRGVIDAQQEKQRHERHLATEHQRDSGRDR